MIAYKNISFSAKTFYGVKFEPGETKGVPGYINSPYMIRTFDVPDTCDAPDKIDTPVVSDTVDTPASVDLFDVVAPVSTRGRRKKSSEPEKDSVAENTETQINQSEEETSNGN